MWIGKYVHCKVFDCDDDNDDDGNVGIFGYF